MITRNDIINVVGAWNGSSHYRMDELIDQRWGSLANAYVAYNVDKELARMIKDNRLKRVARIAVPLNYVWGTNLDGFTNYIVDALGLNNMEHSAQVAEALADDSWLAERLPRSLNATINNPVASLHKLGNFFSNTLGLSMVSTGIDATCTAIIELEIW